MLTMVTLTGADDSVEPGHLLDISNEYPFVEWGILFATRSREPRLPGVQWINRLLRETEGTSIRLSAHFCGAHLTSIMRDGRFPLTQKGVEAFQRCQLNFHGVRRSDADADGVYRAFTGGWNGEVIVQLDSVNDWILDGLLDRNVRASGLYDLSHGAGIKPDEWPKPNQRWEIGYAGGLGPDTIFGDLRDIKQAAGPQRFWIDMETNLRSVVQGCDVFDLRKCRAVLEATAREFAGKPM